MEQLFFKFIKFGIVGFVGLCIDFGITWICKEKLKFNKFIANSCGFFVAVVNNYLLNRVWTFQSHNVNVLGEMGKFLAFAFIGLALNNLLLYFFHEKAGFKFYFAKACAIACVTIWNFGSNFLFNFH